MELTFDCFGDFWMLAFLGSYEPVVWVGALAKSTGDMAGVFREKNQGQWTTQALSGPKGQSWKKRCRGMTTSAALLWGRSMS